MLQGSKPQVTICRSLRTTRQVQGVRHTGGSKGVSPKYMQMQGRKTTHKTSNWMVYVWRFPHEMFWELLPRHNGDKGDMGDKFPHIDPEYLGKEYWCNRNAELIALMNLVNDCRIRENLGICAI